MVNQITNITNGQIIDQSILQQIVSNVNELANSSIQATSIINGNTKSIGQWAVVTQRQTITISNITTAIQSKSGTQFTFTAFGEVPIVCLTISNSAINANEPIQNNVLSSVIATAVTKNSVDFNVLAMGNSVSNGKSTTFNVNLIAIGPLAT